MGNADIFYFSIASLIFILYIVGIILVVLWQWQAIGWIGIGFLSSCHILPFLIRAAYVTKIKNAFMDLLYRGQPPPDIQTPSCSDRCIPPWLSIEKTLKISEHPAQLPEYDRLSAAELREKERYEYIAYALTTICRLRLVPMVISMAYRLFACILWWDSPHFTFTTEVNWTVYSCAVTIMVLNLVIQVILITFGDIRSLMGKDIYREIGDISMTLCGSLCESLQSTKSKNNVKQIAVAVASKSATSNVQTPRSYNAC